MILLRLQGNQPTVNALALQVANSPICQELQGSIIRHTWAEPSRTAYLYFTLPIRRALSRRTLDPLVELSSPGIRMSASRLTLMQSLSGASHAEHASFHYVVETTPETGWEVELQAWYATEHLPGLASVPGCVQAQRFWNHDDGPRSFACYDLVEKQALDSPAWLAVRHTPWSDRVRPHFTNTVRTMFALHS